MALNQPNSRGITVLIILFCKKNRQGDEKKLHNIALRFSSSVINLGEANDLIWNNEGLTV